MAEYAYVTLANEIERDIRSGRLQPGARLPGEVEMGRQYGVASRTARRAVRELRDRGLAETLPSLGTFVVDHPPGE